MQENNLFRPVPDNLSAEVFELLHTGKGVRIERIISQGHASPTEGWYDQEEDEWVALLTGAARLEFEGEDTPRTLAPGDWLLIPAHTRHRVAWTTPDTPSVWLAVHVKV